MSKMFDSQIAHYKEKFHNTMDNISVKAIESSARSNGVSDEFLKTGLLENSEGFRRFCYSFAKTLMPGRVSCTTYAAVVAVIATKFGVDFKAYSGFCLPKNSPKYNEEKASFDKRVAESGDKHPVFATHVYLVINDKYYEYYNGDTSNIDHIDCVEI